MVNPLKNIILRGNDPTGHGYYGAKRGKKKHKGLDLVTVVGEDVFAGINGVITKIGYPYNFALQFRYIEITNDIYRTWSMYCLPNDNIKVGLRVFECDKIGAAQDIAGYWSSKMLNHLHYQVWKHGLLTDPEPLLNYNK